MSNGGRCNVCNGEGHIARDCPSSPGQDGKATDDTCSAVTERVTRKPLVQQPILISKAVEKTKEDGSKMAEKAREEVMDKREVGSRKAEKAKEAEKAKDGAKEKAAFSTSWTFGEEVRPVEEIGAIGTIRVTTRVFGRSAVRPRRSL